MYQTFTHTHTERKKSRRDIKSEKGEEKKKMRELKLFSESFFRI